MNYKYALSTIPDVGIVDNTYVRVPAYQVGKKTMDYDGSLYLTIDIDSPEKPEIAIKILSYEISAEMSKYAQSMILFRDELHPSVNPRLYKGGEIWFFEIYLKFKTVDQALLYKLSL